MLTSTVWFVHINVNHEVIPEEHEADYGEHVDEDKCQHRS